MIIYTQHITNRLMFVLDLVFKRMLDIHYTVVNDRGRLTPDDHTPVINYSPELIGNYFRIRPYGLLSETGLRMYEIKVKDGDTGIPVFFTTDEGDIPFDIFSAIFYLVSRYEEYLPFEADKHNRFPARASVAWKNNFLDLPVVNYWVKNLAKELSSFYPGLILKLPRFSYQPTIDVDQAWAVKNKPFIKIAGGLVKDALKGNAKKVRFRLDILSGKSDDPFFTLPEWDKLHDSFADKLKVFILAGNTSCYDMIVSPENRNWQQMVKTISLKYQAGLHPSYSSHKKESAILREKQLLESLTGNPVIISRQHFLKLRFPDTFRNLLKSGIREDHSMSYPDYPGFRAGIAFPFPFYDLEKDISTELMIYPFAVMDRTLKDYLGLTPSMAIEKLEKLINSVKETGGLFISVWHNDSLSDYDEWKGWKSVYLKMIELCKI